MRCKGKTTLTNYTLCRWKIMMKSPPIIWLRGRWDLSQPQFARGSWYLSQPQLIIGSWDEPMIILKISGKIILINLHTDWAWEYGLITWIENDSPSNNNQKDLIAELRHKRRLYPQSCRLGHPSQRCPIGWARWSSFG